MSEVNNGKIFVECDNQVLEMQALISERNAMMAINHTNLVLNRVPYYQEEDFLDLAVAFRQLGGQDPDME
jgi:hypothetical protein